MRRAPFVSVLLLAFVARATAGDGLDGRVNAALDASAAWLVERQAEDGSWQKEDRVHPLGRTALCTYALLHAGYPRDHAAVQRALGFLAKAEWRPRSTYEAGCLLLLLHALGKERDPTIRSICAWLVSTFDRGPKLWGYPDGTRDLSNTQFAVFGLRVGEMHGFDVPHDLWTSLIRGVLALQHESGAFRYRADAIYAGTMTHAGLLVLRLATESLGQRRPTGDVRQAISRAQRWCEDNYTVAHTPWGRGHHAGHFYYYLYGLERYAQIYGLDRIAGHDWYAEGAEALLARQEENGSWENLEQTCFAILFLKKVVFTAPEGRAIGTVTARPPRPPRPRPAADLPFLRTWLLAGPYRSTTLEDDMLERRDFPLARAMPAAGRKAGRGEWRLHESETDQVEVGKVCGETPWSTYYAAIYLHAAAATEAVLWLGSDDGFRLFLNGKQILEGHHHDYCGDDHYRVPLSLAAGRNVLIVKLENLTYYAYLKARLSDPDGGPIPDVVASPHRDPGR